MTKSKTKTEKTAPAKTKAPKTTKAEPSEPTVPSVSVKQSAAQCIFDLYNLRFGMSRKEVSEVLSLAESGHVNEEALLKVGASMIHLLFDHQDHLWQVKADYLIDDVDEAEALLDRMSKDYRFQTPSSRVAFELNEDIKVGPKTLAVRYTEINLKRIYLHHLMAVGAVKIAEEEKIKKSVEEVEQEEYIPTGPMMF